MERERERERENGESALGFVVLLLGSLLLVIDIISFTAVVCRYFVRVVNDLSCFLSFGRQTSH